MTVPEEPLHKYKEICQFLGWSESKFYRRLPELKRDGFVFYEWLGRPPRKTLTSYPSVLIAYKKQKTLSGEVL